MRFHLATIHICTLDWLRALCNMAGVTGGKASVMRRRRSCNIGERGRIYLSLCSLKICLTFEKSFRGLRLMLNHDIWRLYTYLKEEYNHPAEVSSTVVTVTFP
ncbi:hypothetical protein AVEN_8202-1 [Araneus ventricosus]|uniref:Uncharacterized protein n=1 Tax=Araneus ventricosus TaxID=182803 RepID=A0A4Y2MGN4_ARAVE|nr:hypothetical protein AVEN_8202-1 [Araneus ventricosus]